MDTEVFGEGHSGLGMADAIDVGQGQAGVLEGIQDHGYLEGAAGAFQLAGGGDVVGHADDRCRAPEGPVHPVHRF
jgi:hypothetical protein